MALIDDISTDYTLIEGVESVTIQPQNPEAAAITSVKGLMRAMGGNPLINAIVGIDPNDVTWHLWVATLQGYSPVNGDKITAADGTEYSITSAGESLRSGRVICQAKELARKAS